MIRNENCNEGKCHKIKRRIIPFKGSWSWHMDGFCNYIFIFKRQHFKIDFKTCSKLATP